ncbi:MAG: L-2-hydroxyglutarate oxidase [Candidatus Omnitrophota bacterium]
MIGKTFDFIIIGTGVIGLSVARSLRILRPDASILVLDKEDDVGAHSSGRNSGILHAGFYYSADSLKARFTVQGAGALKDYCSRKNIPVNACGKLVVAMDEPELEMLHELNRRGQRNGSNVRLIDAQEAKSYEPGVVTHKKALYSPDTASLDPLEVLLAIKDDLTVQGVDFVFQARFTGCAGQVVKTTAGDFQARKIINCAGLYADQVAQAFGFGKKYTMIPFKGLYLKYKKNKSDVKINVYPVPNLKNPFLGVHFTKTVDGSIKIGPTAIPAFWRENYALSHRFNPAEMAEIAGHEAVLFCCNSFGFRDLAFDEIKKYNRGYFIDLARRMIPSVDPSGFGEFTRPGIRAQLLDKTTRSLVQDFVVEGDKSSVHVLNAVSPAFTCAFPFADFLCQEFILK